MKKGTSLAKKNRNCGLCNRSRASWDQCNRDDCLNQEVLSVSILDFKGYSLDYKFEIIEEKQIEDPDPSNVVENWEEQYGGHFC